VNSKEGHQHMFNSELHTKHFENLQHLPTAAATVASDDSLGSV
jgi:hypothetical protein